MIFIYLPQLSHTNHDIVSKKAILLLLPISVVQGVPELRMALQAIFAEEDEGSGGSNGREADGATAASLSTAISAAYKYSTRAGSVGAMQQDEERSHEAHDASHEPHDTSI